MPPQPDVCTLAAPVARPLVEDDPAAGEFCGAAGSVLKRLGLDDAALAALRGQGFVSCERRRPHHAPIYKLRYRVQGKQRTRYLGSEPAVIAAVRQELADLQQGVRRAREMQRLLRRVRSGLRHARETLAPVLSSQGYHFHGTTLRRRRLAPVDAQRSSAPIERPAPSTSLAFE